MSLPGLSSARSCLVVSVTLAQTTRFLAGSGETSRFAVLVNGVDNPADTRIAADSLVLRVYEDDFEVLVGRVLVDPVGVENTQVGATTSDALLRSRLEGSLVLELVHTLVGRLACKIFMSKSSHCPIDTIIAYRMLHPWVLAACDLHGEHGHGK